MLVDKCPHCNTRHVQTSERFSELLDPCVNSTWWHVIRCQNPKCQRLILAVTDPQNHVQGIYPVGSYELDASVPISKEMCDDFREAGLCLAAGCYKASMVMSRRVLQRCLKQQGCTQPKLVDTINHAIDNNILRKPFHPIATEIREYGNLGAHPDDDQLANATREKAELILEFARLLIHDFYEVPASATKLKHDRQHAKQS